MKYGGKHMNSKKKTNKMVFLANIVLIVIFITSSLLILSNRNTLNEKIMKQNTTPSVRLLSTNYNNIGFNNIMGINYLLTGLVLILVDTVILTKQLK